VNADIHNDGYSSGARMTNAQDVCRVSIRSVVVEYVRTDVIDASRVELYQFIFLYSSNLPASANSVSLVYVIGALKLNPHEVIRVANVISVANVWFYESNIRLSCIFCLTSDV